jgi:hypothetical protein
MQDQSPRAIMFVTKSYDFLLIICQSYIAYILSFFFLPEHLLLYILVFLNIIWMLHYLLLFCNYI